MAPPPPTVRGVWPEGKSTPQSRINLRLHLRAHSAQCPHLSSLNLILAPLKTSKEPLHRIPIHPVSLPRPNPTPAPGTALPQGSSMTHKQTLHRSQEHRFPKHRSGAPLLDCLQRIGRSLPTEASPHAQLHRMLARLPQPNANAPRARCQQHGTTRRQRLHLGLSFGAGWIRQRCRSGQPLLRCTPGMPSQP